MRAVIVAAPGRVAVGERPDPTPLADEVVIKVGACGICGTDLHIVDGEFPPAPYPLVPGHEFAGEIVAVGTGVTGWHAGDRVAVDPSLFCGHCSYCRRLRGNLCTNWGAIGDTVDGGFADYVRVPAANCYRLPEGMSYSEAALIEPTACAVHGLNRLRLRLGSSLLITGAGTMGLLLLQLARVAGAADIAMVDREASRLDLARRFGASLAVTSVEAAQAAQADGYDYVIEATGVGAVAQQAFAAVRRGGTFLVFGVAPAEARLQISPFAVYNQEVTLLGSMAVLSTFDPAMRVLRSGVIDAANLITHMVPLSEFPRALQLARERAGLKVQVVPADPSRRTTS